MGSTRRRLLRQAGAIAVIAPASPAWSQLASACTPAPQCRRDCGPTAAATEGPFFVVLRSG